MSNVKAYLEVYGNGAAQAAIESKQRLDVVNEAVYN